MSCSANAYGATKVEAAKAQLQTRIATAKAAVAGAYMKAASGANGVANGGANGSAYQNYQKCGGMQARAMDMDMDEGVGMGYGVWGCSSGPFASSSYTETPPAGAAVLNPNQYYYTGQPATMMAQPATMMANAYCPQGAMASRPNSYAALY